MTDTQLADLLRPLMPRIVASVRAQLDTERVTIFADESDDSPQFRPAFGPGDVGRYSDYYADDNGAYPHTLHRHFGMSVRDFADATKLVRKQVARPEGKLAWNWVKRSESQQPQQVDSDGNGAEMFSLEQVNEFSDRKEGETWQTNGRHYKRENGKTVRFAPTTEPAKAAPTKEPTPEPAPEPAKPSKPDKAAVRSRLDAAFADPSKLTADHFAALKDDLLATHTGDELKALAAERKTRLSGTKAVRVQALIDAAKAKVAAAGEKPKGDASQKVDPAHPSSRAKAAKEKLDALVAQSKPLVDEWNALLPGRKRDALGKKIDALDPAILAAEKDLDEARDALANHNGHDYGVYTVSGPGAKPELVGRHTSLESANNEHEKERAQFIWGESRVNYGRDIEDEHGAKAGAWHTKSADGKEVYVAKVPRGGVVKPVEPEPAAEPKQDPVPAPAKSGAGNSVSALDDASFAKKVQAVADAHHAGFGNDKVFISDIYNELKKEDPALNADEFKKRLVRANQLDHLDLSRADLVQHMHPEDVRDSETKHLNAQFHFVRAASKDRTNRGPGGAMRPQAAAPKASSPQEHEASAVDSLHDMIGGKYANLKMAPIHEMRADFQKQHPGASIQDFNDAMLSLRRQGKVRLISIDNRSRATPEQLQNSIQHVGETMFYAEPTANTPAPRAKQDRPSAPAPAAATAQPTAEPPHTKARAALDAIGIAHGHLSDEDVVSRLKAAFAPPATEPKSKPASKAPAPKKPKAAEEQPVSDAGKQGHEKITALAEQLGAAVNADPTSAPSREEIYSRVAKELAGHDPREVAKLNGFPPTLIGNKANALKMIQNSIADSVGAIRRVAADRVGVVRRAADTKTDAKGGE